MSGHESFLYMGCISWLKYVNDIAYGVLNQDYLHISRISKAITFTVEFHRVIYMTTFPEDIL